jgi:adenosine/AMP kinase
MAVKLSNDEVQLENIEQSLIEMVLHKEVPSIITYSAYRELVDDLTKVLSTVKPALRALTESTMDSLKEAL